MNHKQTSGDETKAAAESASFEAESFGGYAARHRYESKRKKKKKHVLQILQTLLLSVLVFLSVLGTVALFRGDFFSDEGTEKDGKGVGTIKVPTRQELGELVQEPEQAIAEVDLSLVTVELCLNDGSSRYGTGFFLSDHGHILSSTALWSDVAEAQDIHIYTVDGAYLNAYFLGSIPELGAAVLLTEEGNGSIPVNVGNFSFLERGETLYAVGAANTKEFLGTVVSGIISTAADSVKVTGNGKTTSIPVLYLDAAPNESLWGAPVIDNTGSTVGFVSHCITPTYGKQLGVVSIHSLYTMVNELLGESDDI